MYLFFCPIKKNCLSKMKKIYKYKKYTRQILYFKTPYPVKLLTYKKAKWKRLNLRPKRLFQISFFRRRKFKKNTYKYRLTNLLLIQNKYFFWERQKFVFKNKLMIKLEFFLLFNQQNFFIQNYENINQIQNIY